MPRVAWRESVHLLQTSAALSFLVAAMGTGASHNLSDEAIEALKTLPEHIQREIAAAAEAATPAINISTPRAEPQPPQAAEPQEEPAASATAAATEEETAEKAFAKAATGSAARTGRRCCAVAKLQGWADKSASRTDGNRFAAISASAVPSSNDVIVVPPSFSSAREHRAI